MTTKKKPTPNESFRKFEELAARVVRVPKKEVDDKEAQRPKRERKPKEA